jgi:Glyoxalase-like domain
MLPVLDHVVIDVQDRIDEGARRFQALGFRLTDRGRHTMGSVNHLAMFGTDYLELLGTGEPGSPVRQELAGFPVGLNGLVFKLKEAAAYQAELKRAGLPVLPVNSFSRPLMLNGKQEEARFNTVRLEPRSVFDGRVYFCEHLTPQFVWRPEWQNHPNGALAVTRLLLAAQDPTRVAEPFVRMFGADAVATNPDGSRVLQAGTARVEIVPAATLLGTLRDFAPEASGRASYLALLGLRVRSLQSTEQTLRAGGITALQRRGATLRVSPREAMNTTLEFIE